MSGNPQSILAKLNMIAFVLLTKGTTMVAGDVGAANRTYWGKFITAWDVLGRNRLRLRAARFGALDACVLASAGEATRRGETGDTILADRVGAGGRDKRGEGGASLAHAASLRG